MSPGRIPQHLMEDLFKQRSPLPQALCLQLYDNILGGGEECLKLFLMRIFELILSFKFVSP